MLAAGLLAVVDGDSEDADQVDRQMGAFRIAEWMLRIEAALKR